VTLPSQWRETNGMEASYGRYVYINIYKYIFFTVSVCKRDDILIYVYYRISWYKHNECCTKQLQVQTWRNINCIFRRSDRRHASTSSDFNMYKNRILLYNWYITKTSNFI